MIGPPSCACGSSPAAWKPVKVQAVRLGDHSAARGHIGSLKNKLQSLQHSVLMVLLEHVASGARLAVGNTHLFSDPKQPHVKSSQGSWLPAGSPRLRPCAQQAPRAR